MRMLFNTLAQEEQEILQAAKRLTRTRSEALAAVTEALAKRDATVLELRDIVKALPTAQLTPHLTLTLWVLQRRDREVAQMRELIADRDKKIWSLQAISLQSILTTAWLTPNGM